MFREAQCGYNNRCPPFTPLSLTFNNQIDAEAFKKEWIQVSPEVPGLDVSVNWRGLSVLGRTKGRTTYTVKISPELQDAYGQTLGKEVSTKWKVGEAEPMAQVEGELFAVMDPHGPRTVSLYSINVPSAELSVRRVVPSDWSIFVQQAGRMGWDKDLPPLTVGKVVDKRTVKIEKKNDELVETRIDLSKGMDAGVGRGVFDLRFARGGRGNVPLRKVQWAESTQLSSTVFTDHDRMVVWVTRLKDGAPVANADVEVLPGKLRGKTNSEGLAEIELPKNFVGSDAGVLVRSGKDSAFMPERQWHGGGVSWQKQEQREGLRWFTFDDRGLYKPKETVNLKGWVRGFSRGPQGDLKPESPLKQVKWSVMGPRRNKIASGRSKLNAQGGFHMEFKLPDDVNLGTGYVQVEAVNAPSKHTRTTHTHGFQIQEFRRPEFEVSASADPAQLFVVQK